MTTNIKILILLPSFAGGGAERTIVNILKYYDRDKFDIKVCLLDYSGPYLQHTNPDDIITPRWAIGKIDLSKFGNIFYMLKSLGFVLKLQYQCIKNFQPEIIMTVTESMNYLGFIWKSLPKFKHIKWILRCGNNSYLEIEKKNTMLFIRKTMILLLKVAYKKSDVALANSKGVENMLVETYGITKSKVRVIYNPIDIEFIQEQIHQVFPVDNEKAFIVAVGRLEYQKRFDILLKAYAKSTAPQQDIKLYILGKGSQEQYLKDLSKTLGVQNFVNFKGFQSNPYMFMNRSKMFILSSQWEGFPHVVAEAIACKTAVLVTDCKYGPSEIIQNNQSGFIVQVNNIKQIQEKIDAILADDNLAQRLAAKGSQRAQDFSVKKIVPEYESLYFSLLSQ